MGCCAIKIDPISSSANIRVLRNTGGLSNEKRKALDWTRAATTGVVIVCPFTLLNWIGNTTASSSSLCVCVFTVPLEKIRE